jgi:hypothetical protein
VTGEIRAIGNAFRGITAVRDASTASMARPRNRRRCAASCRPGRVPSPADSVAARYARKVGPPAPASHLPPSGRKHPGHGRRHRPPLADTQRMVEPHPDQENDEVAIDVCRVTTSLNLQGHPSSATHIAISMNQECRLAPEADAGPQCRPNISIWRPRTWLKQRSNPRRGGSVREQPERIRYPPRGPRGDRGGYEDAG